MTQALPPDPVVGSVLAGRYRIVRRLGEGAMGTVYLAEHLKFGRKDAIKVLRKGMAQEPEAAERFLRGARNASAINHENVCTVYDFSDTEEGYQFLAMEYVEGETLADVIEREGPLPPARVIPIARQIAAALGAAHALGIVHRDLKPGNVMLSRGAEDGERVKVVDFDIAKGTSEGEGHEVTRMGFVVGTPEYMSPEQLIGDPLDGRSDLYSLGVVVFRMVTGALPSRAKNTQDLMVERLTADPLRLDEVAPGLEVPEGLQEVLDRLLRRKREERFGSAREVALALEELGRTGPPPTRLAPAEGMPRASSGGERMTQPATGDGRVRSRAALLGGGLAALAVIGVAGWMLLGSEGAGIEDAAVPPAEEPVQSASLPADDLSEEEDDDDPDPPTPADPEPSAPSPALPPERVGEILLRQMDSLVAAEGNLWLAAAQDTARLAWETRGASPQDRSLAAYLMASARVELGDTTGAVTWLRRALDVNPANRGARTLLEQLGGGP